VAGRGLRAGMEMLQAGHRVKVEAPMPDDGRNPDQTPRAARPSPGKEPPPRWRCSRRARAASRWRASPSPGEWLRRGGECSPKKGERLERALERSPKPLERSPSALERCPRPLERSTRPLERCPSLLEHSPRVPERSPSTLERCPAREQSFPFLGRHSSRVLNASPANR
jgi:hypothetical protein